MTQKKKTYLISLIVLLVCLLMAGIIYLYTGDIVIAIFFAPPIIHWILDKRRRRSENQ